MIDEVLVKSFTLDYELLKNKCFFEKMSTMNSNFLNPKIKTNDLFKEFEDYVKQTRENFLTFTKLFDDCNEQRKIIKEKSLLDKLVIKEKNEFLLKQITIHEELRFKIIDDLNRRLTQSNFLLNEINKKFNNKINTVSELTNLSNSQKNKKSFNNKSIYDLEKRIHRKIEDNQDVKFENCEKKALVKPKRRSSSITGNGNIPKILDNSVAVTDSTLSSKNMRYCQENIEVQLKNLLSFDFNEEKYNIISSSPINYPKDIEEKNINLLKNFDEYNLSEKDSNFNSILKFKDENKNLEHLVRNNLAEKIIKCKYKSQNNSPHKEYNLDTQICNTERDSQKIKIHFMKKKGIENNYLKKKISEKNDTKYTIQSKQFEEKIKENMEKYKVINSINFNVRDYFSNQSQAIKLKKLNENFNNKKSSKINPSFYNTINNANLSTPFKHQIINFK